MATQVIDVGVKVARLRDALEQVRRRRAWRAGWTRRWIPTGLGPLDAALPGGGLPCGAMTEILCDTPGVGAMTLALQAAVRCLGDDLNGEVQSSKFEVQREGTKNERDFESFRIPHSAFHILHSSRVVVFVDRDGDFYPPAAWGLGLPVDRLVVVRPQNERDAYWAMDQSLRCAAVAAVVGSLQGLNDALARRLQLAAESCGGVGIVLRPVARPTHRFAAVQMRIEGVPPPLEQPDARRCRITLLTVREGTPVEPFCVDLNHETRAGDPSALPGDAAATG